VAGERRLRAAQAAGLSEVPAVVSDCDAGDGLYLALAENLHREDLNPVEIAHGLAGLVKQGHNQADIARRLSRPPAWVSRHLGLLDLPEAWQRAMVEPDRTGNVLSEAAAQELRRLRVLDEVATRPTGSMFWLTWAEWYGTELIYGNLGIPGSDGTPPVRTYAGVRQHVDRILAWLFLANKNLATISPGKARTHVCGADLDPRVFSDWLHAATLYGQVAPDYEKVSARKLFATLTEAADRIGDFATNPFEPPMVDAA
jgi:hypothetical protein